MAELNQYRIVYQMKRSASQIATTNSTRNSPLNRRLRDRKNSPDSLNGEFGVTSVLGVAPLIGKLGKLGKGSKLARNLQKAGRPVAKGLERAHHIVAKAAKAAEPARKKLRKFGIDIDDAFNGIGLPKKFHEHLHTKEYYDRVNREAKNWNSKDDAIKGLTGIAEELLGLAK